MLSTSTLAFTRASTRSIQSAVTPMAAPHSRRPFLSLAELGYLVLFSISLMVIRPHSSYLSFTMGSFSMRWRARMALASSSVVPTGAVIRFSLVITSPIWRLSSVSKRRSRLVRMPTRRLFSVMGTPLMRYLLIISLASAIRCVGDRKKGSVITPCSLRFTLSTCAACSAMVIFLWITPIPPSRASAMAILASVTVSMAAERMGIFSLILLVSWMDKSASLGSTSLLRGTSKTSSNVRPSRI